MGRIYRTAQGRQLDMETVRLQNELVPALGNMKVNARGDQLGPGGKIVKTREAIMDEFYKTNTSAVVDNIPESGSIPTSSSIRRAPESKIPSRSKVLEPEFRPGNIAADETTGGKVKDIEQEAPIPAAQDLKGGLAAAVARSKAKEKKVKRL